MTQARLNKLGLLWQKRMRLQDWKVTYSLVSPDEPHAEGIDGETSYNHSLKKAKVRIVKGKPDMEDTLVHELTHLHFAGFEPERNTAAHTVFEQGIECVSIALTGLSRRS